MNVKKLLTDSIISLLEKDTIDNITVEMILKKSGISKATFYKYFRDKMDLTTYIFSSFMESNEEAFKSMPHEEMSVVVLEFMKKNQRFFMNAFKSKGQNSCEEVHCNYSRKFCESAYRAAKGTLALTPEENMYFEFNTAGGFAVLKKWVDGGMKESPEMIAKLIYSCMPEALRAYIK